MIRGIYSAASGMLAESIRSDNTANNIANVNTAGFKKNTAITKSFNEVLVTRMDEEQENIGQLNSGAFIDEIATDFSPGPIRQTGRNLDFAIEGNGFFTVKTPNEIQYTKNGSFSLNNKNELVTASGNQVLDAAGQVITLTGPVITARSDGIITDGNREFQLGVVSFTDSKQLEKVGSSLYRTASRPTAANFVLQQGSLEQSNVNTVSEMVNMISGFRAYEINAKVVQSHDQLLEKAVNEVGKV